MKPTPIIDRTLQKPWLLIAVYENLFDRYIDLGRQYETAKRHHKLYKDQQTMLRVNLVADTISETSRALRDTDQLIHNYIVNHNKPVQRLKTA